MGALCDALIAILGIICVLFMGLLGFIAIIFAYLLVFAIYGALAAGFVYTLSLFLPIPFSVKTVAGVWLSVCFLKMIFSGNDKRKK